jgi:hypothetical protein
MPHIHPPNRYTLYVGLDSDSLSRTLFFSKHVPVSFNLKFFGVHIGQLSKYDLRIWYVPYTQIGPLSLTQIKPIRYIVHEYGMHSQERRRKNAGTSNELGSNDLSTNSDSYVFCSN